MPTTRAARRAARCLTEVLSADALSLVLYQLELAHDIAAMAPTCHVLCDAAKLAAKLRPFSKEVVTLAGHTDAVNCVSAAPDGRIITGADDRTAKVWRVGACERTIACALADGEAYVYAVAVLPGGMRFVSIADGLAKLWTLDGTLERTFETGSHAGVCVYSVAALPDGVHFVVGLGYGDNNGDIRLYHVDDALVHTFEGHDGYVEALAKRRSPGSSGTS